MPYTLNDMRRRVMDRYGMPSKTPEWIDAYWLLNRVNDAQREVAELTECIAGTAAVSGTSANRTYSYTTDFIRIDTVEWTTQGELDKTNREFLHTRYGDTWRTATGAASKWYDEDGRYFGIYPKIRPGSAGTVYLYGPRYPAVPTGGVSVIEVPTSLADAVALYVCREMAEIDPKASEARWDRFNKRYEQAVYKYRTMRPATLTMSVPSRR